MSIRGISIMNKMGGEGDMRDCVSSADRAGEDKGPKEERKMNGGCASRGKILSEEHKTENKMDGRKQESRKKERKEKNQRQERRKPNPGTLLET